MPALSSPADTTVNIYDLISQIPVTFCGTEAFFVFADRIVAVSRVLQILPQPFVVGQPQSYAVYTHDFHDGNMFIVTI